MPGLYNRKADTWRPLFAIAETASGNWVARVNAAVTALIDSCDESESTAVLLLADIRQIFNNKEKEDWLSSADIIEELLKREDAPWQEWRNGKAITQAGIARLLKPFGIRLKQHRFEDVRADISSYQRNSFHDAFYRYLPPDQSFTLLQPAFESHSAEFQSSIRNETVELTKALKPTPHKVCRGVELRKPGNGTRVWTKPAFEVIPSPTRNPGACGYQRRRTYLGYSPARRGRNYRWRWR
jgi:hypothetical protein